MNPEHEGRPTPTLLELADLLAASAPPGQPGDLAEEVSGHAYLVAGWHPDDEGICGGCPEWTPYPCAEVDLELLAVASVLDDLANKP